MASGHFPALVSTHAEPVQRFAKRSAGCNWITDQIARPVLMGGLKSGCTSPGSALSGSNRLPFERATPTSAAHQTERR